MADINTLLRTVPELRDAQVVRQLTDGPLADKSMLRAGDDLYSVRIDRPAASAIGLDRNAELTTLRALSAAGWSDPPLYADPEQGVLVLHWVEGEAVSPAAFHDPRWLRRFAARLCALHLSAVVLPPLRLDARNDTYAAVAGSRQTRQQAAEVSALLIGAGEGTGAGCPCHNDPVAGNVLGGAEPRFIDFEYAAAGNSHFDLAAVIEYHGLGDRASEALLAGYRAAGGVADPEMLGVWRQIYRLTAANWAAAVDAISG